MQSRNYCKTPKMERAAGFLSMVLALFLALPCEAQNGYRVESVAQAPDGLADAVAEALAPEGFRLLKGDGEPVAVVWLRKEIPLKANAAAANYGALAEGTLVGVLRFPEGGSDFRGQAIGAGLYTLRYEQIPQDGNHMGASPEPDFVLLCPAAEDQDLNAKFDFDTLVELSRHATGTNHPGPMMLLPATAGGEFPGIQRNDMGYVALRLKTVAKADSWDQSKDFPLALTLVGKAEF